jgi:radical SAM protein with 4Fe4S-binding SPASM domain
MAILANNSFDLHTGSLIKSMSHKNYNPYARPSYIQFYPTLNCNYSCPFCFNRSLPSLKDIDVNDFHKILLTLKHLGIDHIDMLGGEPTLHPHLLKLIDLIHHNRLKTTISTNGTHIDLLTAILETYPKKSVRIGVSLNSEEVSNDLHTFIVTFKPILKSIYSKQRILPKSCTTYIGMPGIEYFLLFMDVTDQNDLKYSMPFYRFYQDILKLKTNTGNIDGVFCSGFIPDSIHYPELEFVRCPAGTTKLSLLPNGDMYPCYLFFQFPEFRLGNILADDFNTIWHHPILNHFRTFKRNTCPKTSCSLFDACHGGCPALSYIFYNTLDGPDPRCMQEE